MFWHWFWAAGIGIKADNPGLTLIHRKKGFKVITLKDAIAGIIMLILIYLLVANGAQTKAVLGALGDAVTKETMALQGR